MLVLAGAFVAAIFSHFTHPLGSILNFDEGFHGGAAFAISDLIRQVLHLPSSGVSYRALIQEFFNGFAVYPPTWTFVAVPFVFFGGATIGVLRAATLPFYILTIFSSYWFVVRATKDIRAGIAAAVAIATVPLVVIYSDTIMLEVPVLLGVTDMLSFFYLYTEGILARTKLNIAYFAAIGILATLTKLAALPLIVALIVAYIVTVSVIGWKEKAYRRFLLPELVLVLLASIASMIAFEVLERALLHFDLIVFHLNQTAEGYPGGALGAAFYQLWDYRWYYLQDFLRMPFISLAYAASLIYVVWRRRDRLGILLVVWTVGTYLFFTALSPHETLVIIPIFAPLAIAFGLALSDVVELSSIRAQQSSFFSLAVIVLAVAQIMALPHSDSGLWRTNQTQQAQAGVYVANHAAYGDRVLGWYDGTTLAIRLASKSKHLQLVDGVQQVCPKAIRDSYEWAVVTEQPPYASQLDMSILSRPPWHEVADFGVGEQVRVFQNTEAKPTSTFEPEHSPKYEVVEDSAASNGKAVRLTNRQDSAPSFWGCYHLLSLGQHTITFRIRVENIANSVPDTQPVLQLEYSPVPYGKEDVERKISASELRSSMGYQEFSITVNHKEEDRQGEFKVFVEQPATILLDQIRVQ
jgi:4-amino-4-deoxy-L-arabinose transferase-like glycosyltransferase